MLAFAKELVTELTKFFRFTRNTNLEGIENLVPEKLELRSLAQCWACNKYFLADHTDEILCDNKQCFNWLNYEPFMSHKHKY